MLNPLRAFATVRFLRTISRDLARLADSAAATNALLARLADRFAPVLTVDPSPATRAVVKADTGVSHVDVDDVVLAEYFTARSEASTGHTPDEEEVLIYLGDERTKDLHERLATRDGELERLMEGRR